MIGWSHRSLRAQDTANTRNGTSVSSAGFHHATPAVKLLQPYALDHTATRRDIFTYCTSQIAQNTAPAIKRFVLSAASVSCTVCRDSSVGISTRYGLDGPGMESRWGARFSTPVQTGPGADPASNAVGTGSVYGCGGGVSGRGVALTTCPYVVSMLKKE